MLDEAMQNTMESIEHDETFSLSTNYLFLSIGYNYTNLI